MTLPHFLFFYVYKNADEQSPFKTEKPIRH
jgi:hypothetical protein